MNFSRTASGLSNMAQFCGAEIIVFTEGGSTSYTTHEALNGNFNTHSVDIKFWSAALKKYGFNKKLHFRALGSKTSAEEIAIKVANLEVKNVIVVRDSDLDYFLGSKIDSPYVLYTYGYSWENDVWHKNSLISQVISFNMSVDLPEPCIELINKSFSTLDNYAKRLLLLELIHRKNGLSFITSCTGEQFINSRSQPNLKMSSLLKLLREKKEKITRPAKGNANFNLQDAIRYCYGKLYECLAYNVLCYVSKTQLGIRTIPKAVITSIMIDKFSVLQDPNIDHYYQQMIDRLRRCL